MRGNDAWWQATWPAVMGKKQSFKLFTFPPEYESIKTVIFTVKRLGAIDMFGPNQDIKWAISPNPADEGQAKVQYRLP